MKSALELFCGPGPRRNEGKEKRSKQEQGMKYLRKWDPSSSRREFYFRFSGARSHGWDIE